jgi:hypothetical protein
MNKRASCLHYNKYLSYWAHKLMNYKMLLDNELVEQRLLTALAILTLDKWRSQRKVKLVYPSKRSTK